MACFKYLEMISAYIDGELDADEAAELEAHISGCEDCRSALEAYREISADIGEDLVEVPAGFTENVMTAVRQRSRRKAAYMCAKLAGLAACIAIAVIALPRLTAQKASYDAADCAAPKEAYDTTNDMDYGSEYSAEADFALESAPKDDATSGDVQTDGGTQENEKVYSSVNEYGGDYSMVVTIHGQPPEELNDYEGTESDNGETHWIIPTKAADELAKSADKYEVSVYNMEIDNALIILIP